MQTVLEQGGLKSLVDSSILEGIFGANQAFDSAREFLDDDLASRGLGFSQGGASAIAGLNKNRLNQIIQMMVKRPQLLEAVAQGRTSNLANLFRSLPVGRTSTRSGTAESIFDSTEEFKGTNVQPGSATGEGLATGGLIGSKLIEDGIFDDIFKPQPGSADPGV
jgi:hypothetical protein